MNPDVKFLRTRAGALGFASLSSSTSSRTDPVRLRIVTKHAGPRLKNIVRDEEDDDPFGDEDGEDDDDRGDAYEDDDVDLDVLPTLLVYRDGELVYNWVRVDWEAGEQGVEELLYKCVLSVYCPSPHHITTFQPSSLVLFLNTPFC